MAKGREILKVDKITGEIAGRYMGIAHALYDNPDYFYNYYGLLDNAKYKRLHNSRYVFRYIDDYEPHERFAGHKKSIPLRVSFGGVVLNTAGTLAASCFYANNINDIVELLNVSRSTISDAIRRNYTVRGNHIEKLAYMGDLDRNSLRYGYILVVQDGCLHKHVLKGGKN